MTMRKWTTALIALSMVASVAGTAVAAPNVPGAVYSDSQASGVNKPVQQVAQELQAAGVHDVQPTDWFAGSVTVIVQSGLLPPTQDGQFHPEAKLNAGDGIAVFAKVLGVAAKNDTPEQAIAKMAQAGIVPPTTTPNHDMSRLEVAKLLGKALGVEPKLVLSPTSYPFNDYDSTPAEDRGILAALYDLGIFKGYVEDGARTFRPNNILTRAEISILIDRILGAGL